MTMATSRKKEEFIEHSMTVDYNDKGGMDTVKFEKYLK